MVLGKRQVIGNLLKAIKNKKGRHKATLKY